MKEYKELRTIANRIEEIRLELFNNEEHKRNVDYDFQHVDDELFHLQSAIRELVNDFLEI